MRFQKFNIKRYFHNLMPEKTIKPTIMLTVACAEKKEEEGEEAEEEGGCFERHFGLNKRWVEDHRTLSKRDANEYMIE